MIRWGILSTGRIASVFAGELSLLPEAELVAVGSRSGDSARRFAQEFNVSRTHDSYAALANDPDVDVIYVATPHPMHKDNCLLCLQAGKAVLCEKPFTINAGEAAEVIELAQEKQLFLMEAMFTRFTPALVKARQLLDENAIGDVLAMSADFAGRAAFDPQSRLFAKELGGGALLDLGVYTVSLASMVFGAPSRITSMAHLGETGVDEQAAIVLGYDDGAMATLFTSLRVGTPNEVIISGATGRIKLHTPIFRPQRLTLSLDGKDDEDIDAPYVGDAYSYEAAEVMKCLGEGKLQSEIMPLEETLEIMRTMDEIRSQWGLKYPGE